MSRSRHTLSQKTVVSSPKNSLNSPEAQNAASKTDLTSSKINKYKEDISATYADVQLPKKGFDSPESSYNSSPKDNATRKREHDSISSGYKGVNKRKRHIDEGKKRENEKKIGRRVNTVLEKMKGFERKKDKPFDKTNDELQRIRTKYGTNSKEVSDMCTSVCNQIKNSSEHILAVQSGYRFPDIESTAFLVFLKDGTHIQQLSLCHPLNTFEIIYRHIGEFSKEEFEVQKYINHRQMMSSTPKKESLRTRSEIKSANEFDTRIRATTSETLSKHSKRLMDSHQNLNIISGSSVKSKRVPHGKYQFEDQDCIVLYVRVKGFVPLAEEPFPREIDDIPTDVREAAFELYHPDDVHEKIKIGSQVMTNDRIMFGTIGPFVDFDEDGVVKVACITSAHAVLSTTDLRLLKKEGQLSLSGRQDDACLQMYCIASDGLHFGKIIKAVYDEGNVTDPGCEAVLIAVLNRLPDNGITAPNADQRTLIFNSGNVFSGDFGTLAKSVLGKYGASTGLTEGIIDVDGTSVVRTATIDLFGEQSSTSNEFLLHTQIKVRSKNIQQHFASKGDSGSLVCVEIDEKAQALGLVTGGHTDGSAAFITPMSTILKKLGLPIRSKAFRLVEFEAETVSTLQQHGKQLDDIQKSLSEIKNHLLSSTSNRPNDR